ncbi:hypothetical protein PAAG_08543 [Paracoccidioides lutzii Pb01]|uniref:Uncharacterized protein n=1 Tax=Paracoccidioides lutzii (strain ATCC MYA-826 / Pb01) TaxID=502779 RepID=C1HCQ2_PARBA|nr:hypothetical protein PAAG_08543 [Paracoccidioides lutzii Pb01]EEH38816.2 hypothetical protein PAAG_08543 [Paracoccidioides lutzii Pb01]
MPAGKPSINKDHLESNGITYDESVPTHDDGGHAGSTLPTHVRNRFEQAAQTYLATGRDRNDNNSFRPPESAYMNDFDTPSVLAEDLQLQMNHGVNVAKKIQHGVEMCATDIEWQFMLQKVFRCYEDLNALAEQHWDLLDQFSLQKNILWDDTENRVDNRLAKLLKPDFSYGYTIYEDISSSLQSTELVTNFSLQSLWRASFCRFNLFSLCFTPTSETIYLLPSGECGVGRPEDVLTALDSSENGVYLVKQPMSRVGSKGYLSYRPEYDILGVKTAQRALPMIFHPLANPTRPKLPPRSTMKKSSRSKHSIQLPSALQQASQGHASKAVFYQAIPKGKGDSSIKSNNRKHDLRSSKGREIVKQQNGMLRSSHLGPVIDTEIRKEIEHGIDDHGAGNRATENEEEPPTGGLIVPEVAEGKQDAGQAEDCKEWTIPGGTETYKPGDVNCWRLDEDTGVDKCHTGSSVSGTEIISSCSRPLKWEEYEEWKGSPREVSENKNAQSYCEDRKGDFWDTSNQQAKPTTGECLHCRTKFVEELELLLGYELPKLSAVSKRLSEIRGGELLDATCSVLELWVSRSDSVPSVSGLEKILQELSSVLEPHDTIQPEQMWATEVGIWEKIDQALQTLHQSNDTKLRNLLVWTIEYVDLVDIIDLFDILKFGELSCAHLKCMKQEAKSIMDLSQD